MENLKDIYQNWRFKNGRLIHDADCRFWSLKICTCGLLHRLVPEMDLLKNEDWILEELVEHGQTLDKLLDNTAITKDGK